MTPRRATLPKDLRQATVLTMEGKRFPEFPVGFRTNISVKAVETSRVQYEALYELVSIEVGDDGNKTLVWERQTPLVKVAVV